MASQLGRNAFTVQESVNMESFSDYNFEEIAYATDGSDPAYIEASSSYITPANPAKKVVIYDSSEVVDSDDYWTIYLNGETDSQKGIIIQNTNLPFTISGLLLTALKVRAADGITTSGDKIGILSFH
jgi:hypothetical protein